MPTIHNTLGILFDATVVSATLYGVGCLQAWLYFRNHSSRDSYRLKCLVAFVLVCDTAQQAILTACVYTYIITNFGNPDVLSHLVKTLVIEVFFENFIALAVQFFYCYRVFRLSNGNWAVSGCLAMISLGSFVALLVYSIKTVQLTKIADLGAVKRVLDSVMTDVLITSVLIYYLATAKKGLKQTDHMINRLIAFTFNTGIPTSLCGVAACIAINVSPDTFIYMFWFIMFGRLYTNTLLVTLNTRNYIRSVGSGVHSFSLSPPSQCQFDVSPRGATGSTIEVRINTSQEEFQDQPGPGSESAQKKTRF